MFAEQVESTKTTKTTNIFPTDWLAALSDLIQELPEIEFETVDALCVAVAGDVAAGLMLKRVFAWHKSKSGEFYISESKWYAQCGVSSTQVRRVKKNVFPMLGITWEVKPAQRGREGVTHYRFNPWAFLRQLAKVVNITALKLAGRLVGKQPDVQAESDGTLTIKNPIKNNNKNVDVESLLPEKVNDFSSSNDPKIDVLVKQGKLYPKVAERYKDLPLDVIEACIDAANEPRVKNKVKYLIGALNNQQSSPSPNPFPASKEGERGKVDYQALIDTPSDADAPSPPNSGEKLDKPRFQFDASHLDFAKVRGETVVAIADDIDAAAAEAWKATVIQLECQLDKATFDLHVRPVRLVDYADGEYVVQVHNSFARDMLQHRLYRNVWRILSDISGNAEVSVRFDAPEKQEIKSIREMMKGKSV